MGEHTPLPWTYRPHRYDDWGYIRGPKDGLMSVGPIAAIARGESDQSHDEHRAAGTDPYAANAAFIVRACNNFDAMLKALQAASEYLESDAADGFRPAHRLRAEIDTAIRNAWEERRMGKSEIIFARSRQNTGLSPMMPFF
jgi:hypothetical protein